MTCSSSTTCSPDPWPARGRRLGGRGLRAGLAAIAGLLALAAGPVAGEAPGSGAQVSRALAAIRRGDGIDAEMRLRAAIEQGAERRDVNALMGEALLAQGDEVGARRWLARGEFSPATAAAGWRALGLLERRDGNLPASGRAYDRALALTPADAGLWVEIGRLRYAGGEHRLAIEAADHALSLDGANVPALTFRGELVRDRYGLLAALPWFERAILLDQKDVDVLLEYAATLGELGRASECLTVTRRVLDLSPKNPRAYYLQAVLAARAGNYPLARRLLLRTKGKLDDEAGVQMLRGAAELAVGNEAAAAQALEAVLRQRPDDRAAQDLLARALYLRGEYRYLTLRFADAIGRGEVSPYLVTVVARASEALGQRGAAGDLLDRAARPARASLRVLGRQGRIGELLASGQGAAALAAAEGMRRTAPGFYDANALAGDVQLALGHPREAQARYAAASDIRLPESLFERRIAAYAMAGDLLGGRDLIEGYLLQNPTSRVAQLAAARLAMAMGDAGRARRILAWLRDTGGAGDVRLLADLAMAEAGTGDSEAATAAAAVAYRLQRSNASAAQSLAFGYVTLGQERAGAVALLDKAQAIAGTTPLIAAAREQLRARREG